MEHLYLLHLIFLVSFHLLVLGVGKEHVGGDAGVRKWNGFAHYCISVSSLFLTNAWSCISFPPPICFSPRGSKEFMCPWGHGEDYLWSMHRPPVHAVHFGPCWCLSSCYDLNTGTSFTCISLVLFGVWRYHAGTHYQSPCIPAICLWSPSLCASLGPKTAHPLVPPPPPISLPELLDHLSSTLSPWGTSSPLSGYPSSSLLPPMQLSTSVPVRAECQLKCGTLLETCLLTSCAGTKQIFLSSPVLVCSYPSLYPTWVGAVWTVVSVSPPTSASVLLSMLCKSGKAGASRPSRHWQKGFAHSLVVVSSLLVYIFWVCNILASRVCIMQSFSIFYST